MDHIEKTKAQLAACARRGQWNHVMAIGGFRTVEAAKVAMGYSKSPEPVLLPPSPAEPLSAKQALKYQAPPPPRVRDDRAWVDDVRRQMDELSVTASELSLMMGYDKNYVASMLAPKGSRGPTARDRIERTLKGLYALRAAQGDQAA